MCVCVPVCVVLILSKAYWNFDMMSWYGILYKHSFILWGNQANATNKTQACAGQVIDTHSVAELQKITRYLLPNVAKSHARFGFSCLFKAILRFSKWCLITMERNSVNLQFYFKLVFVSYKLKTNYQAVKHILYTINTAWVYTNAIINKL